MAKFRKKPIVIEAVVWHPAKRPALFPQWFWDEFGVYPERLNKETGELTIRTLEGDMIAQPGDYIIQGVKGELYPCKPGIFEASYEHISD